MKYTVWVEGYSCTGDHQPAQCWGILPGKSFQEVCDNCFNEHGAYDSKRLTLWGCRMFDNETDARKSFG